MKKFCILCALLFSSVLSAAQVPVALPPWFKQQLFDANGRTLSFGCVFTYVSNTTTPLASYTDSTGMTTNTDPIILDAGGFLGTGGDGLWLAAGTAYTISVKSAGGTNCASGTTLYTVDTVGGGLTILTTNVTYSATPSFPIQAENQLFEITLTGDAVAQPVTAVGILPPAWVAFEITQDGAGGHSFTWPSNSIGGCTIGSTAGQVTTQFFVWDGTYLRATGPCVTGNGPSINTGDIVASGTIAATGRITGAGFSSTCANVASAGTIRLCKTDSVNWRNQGNSADYGIVPDSSDRGVWSFAGGLETSGAVPDIFLGGTSASFPRLKRNSTAINFRLADDSNDAPITASTLGLSDVLTSTSSTYDLLGNEVSTPGSPPASGKDQLYPKASRGYCAQDSAGVEYCTIAGASQQIQHISTSSACTTAGGASFTNCTDTLTWPSTFGTTSYDVSCTGTNANMSGDPSTAETSVLAIDSQSATQVVVITMSNRSTATHYSKIACIGIK